MRKGERMPFALNSLPVLARAISPRRLFAYPFFTQGRRAARMHSLSLSLFTTAPFYFAETRACGRIIYKYMCKYEYMFIVIKLNIMKLE